jgi:hypothetical protein
MQFADSVKDNWKGGYCFIMTMPDPILTKAIFMDVRPSGQATNCAATQKLPSILWNRGLIAVFTRALHRSLS